MPTVARRPAAQQDRQQLQARRLRATESFATGVGQAEVAPSSASPARACTCTRQLRHRQPDRGPRRAAALSRRREGHLAVGRAARPPQPRHARLVEHPAALAGGRAAAGLRARAQPGGGSVVVAEGYPARQPHLPTRSFAGLGSRSHDTSDQHPEPVTISDRRLVSS